MIQSLFGFRSRELPGYQDLYTMKIEGEQSGPRHLSGFDGIPVYWGSSLKGFQCTHFLSIHDDLLFVNVWLSSDCYLCNRCNRRHVWRKLTEWYVVRFKDFSMLWVSQPWFRKLLWVPFSCCPLMRISCWVLLGVFWCICLYRIWWLVPKGGSMTWYPLCLNYCILIV